MSERNLVVQKAICLLVILSSSSLYSNSTNYCFSAATRLQKLSSKVLYIRTRIDELTQDMRTMLDQAKKECNAFYLGRENYEISIAKLMQKLKERKHHGSGAKKQTR